MLSYPEKRVSQLLHPFFDCFYCLHIVDDSITLDAKLLNHVVKLYRESKIIPCYIQATSNDFYIVNNYLSRDGSYATIFIPQIHQTQFDLNG